MIKNEDGIEDPKAVVVLKKRDQKFLGKDSLTRVAGKEPF